MALEKQNFEQKNNVELNDELLNEVLSIFEQKGLDYEEFMEEIFPNFNSDEKGNFLETIKNSENKMTMFEQIQDDGFPDNLKEGNKKSDLDMFIETFGIKEENIGNGIENEFKKLIDEKEEREEIIKNDVKLDKEISIKINEKITEIQELYPSLFERKEKVEQSAEFLGWRKKREKQTDLDVSLFIIETNYTKLLELAKKRDVDEKLSGEESHYLKLVKNLKFLKENSGLNIDIKDIDDELNKVVLSSSNSIGPKRAEIIKSTIDTTDYHRTVVDGDRISYGDQVVDISENKKYIKSKNGYLLESSSIEYKIDKVSRRNIYKFEKKIEGNKGIIDAGNQKIDMAEKKVEDVKGMSMNEEQFDALYKHYVVGNGGNAEIKSHLKEMEENPKTDGQKVELKKLLIYKFNQDIKETNEEVKKAEEKNKGLEGKVAILKEMEESRRNEFRNSILNRDKKTRETIKIIETSGFDAISQNFTDEVLARLYNENLDLGGGLYFNSKEFNLDKGEFGLPDTQDGRKAELLARLVNKIITGTGDGGKSEGLDVPVDVNNIKGNFGVGIGNTSKFREDLSSKYNVISSSGTFNYDLVMNNLRKGKNIKKEGKKENMKN